MDAITLISNERERQKRKYSPEHDDDHTGGEIARTAAQLAGYGVLNGSGVDQWGLVAKTAGKRIRQLTVAGALIAAEIDRLNREAVGYMLAAQSNGYSYACLECGRGIETENGRPKPCACCSPKETT